MQIPLNKFIETLDRLPWLLPLISFTLGCASFVLVHRGSELAKITAYIVLAGWLWLLLQPIAKKYLRFHLNKRMSNLISLFISQSIQQEILFFSLPFVLLSTTLQDLGQVLFTSLVVGAAVVSTIDPLYEKYVASHRLSSIGFHSLSSFVAALVVLPIVVQIPLEQSFYIALIFVVLGLLIAIPGIMASSNSSREVLFAGIIILCIPAGLNASKAHIPAASLFVSKSRITGSVLENEPGAILRSIKESELEDGLYAYSAISAPRGLAQEIIFHWQHENYSEKIVSEIVGGREEGYRTYTYKQNFIENPQGDWVVDITTAQGQLLERLEFNVYR